VSVTDIGFVSYESLRVWAGGRVREFLRGAVRLHILHHAAEGEIHGAWMAEELKGHGYEISPGTLYPTLHRLEAGGLLTSEQRVVDGRTRRVYRATKAGRAALAEDRTALAELAREVLGDEHRG
jgi:DNA-binding PadR family transcriptional regulator